MKILLLLCVLQWITQSQGLNILVVTAGKSHIMYMGNMARALANNDHNVTAIACSNIKIMPEFLTGDIKWLRFTNSSTFEDISPEVARTVLKASLGEASQLDVMSLIGNMAQEETKLAMELYDDKELIETLKHRKFDFVVLDHTNQPFLILPHLLDIPYAGMQVEADAHQQRVPIYASYVPNILTGYTDQMSFSQRVANIAIHYVVMPILQYVLVGVGGGFDETARIVPDKSPVSYYDLASNASLFFTLRVPGLHFVRGSMPHMLDMGGVMGRPANLNNIPEDMAAFINKSSPDGFIIVSFGSWLDHFPDTLIRKFLTAFSSIKQSVIWKISEDPSEHYPNIQYVRWLPQNDLLGHPKVRAFITHCGGSSVLETTYHGVPIIGMPLGLDQNTNANLMKNRNYGVVLSLSSLSVEDLVFAINNVTDPTSIYLNNIQKASAIFKDQPDPGKTASFWIEHVVKHGRDHLRSVAFEMTWYQYYSLDVMAVLCLAAAIICKITMFTVSLCWKMCCKRKVKSD